MIYGITAEEPATVPNFVGSSGGAAGVNLYVDADSFPTPTVMQRHTVYLTALDDVSDSEAFYPPLVNTEEVAPGLVTSADSFFAPVLTTPIAYLSNGGIDGHTGVTSATVPLPPTRPHHNFIIAEIQVMAGSQTIAVSGGGGGWQIGDFISDASASSAWAWRIADGTESAPTFSWAASAANHVESFQIAGNDFPTAIGATAHASGTSTLISLAGLTTTRDGSLIAALAFVNGASQIITIPSGMTNIDQYNDSFGSDRLAYEIVTTSGSTSDGLSETISSANWHAYLIEVRQQDNVADVGDALFIDTDVFRVPTVSGISTLMHGVNISILEWGAVPHNMPTDRGTPGSAYTYPVTGEATYFWNKGMKLLRLPVLWERLQYPLGAGFTAEYFNPIVAWINFATGLGHTVIFDLHNYVIYNGKKFGDAGSPSTSDFAATWATIANQFKTNPLVWFGLMNEPHDVTAALWFSYAAAAITAIRGTGATNKILCSGIGWDTGHFFVADNASEIASNSVVNSDSNIAFEIHVYPDVNESGIDPGGNAGNTYFVASSTVFSTRLASVTSWAESNGYDLVIGETHINLNISPIDPNGPAALTDLMNFMKAHQCYLGYTWQLAGPWSSGSWDTIEPTSNFTVDKPAMTALLAHIP